MPSQLNRMHGIIPLGTATDEQLMAELQRRIKRASQEAPEERPEGALVPGMRVRTVLQPNDAQDKLHGRHGTLEGIDERDTVDSVVGQFTHRVALDSDLPYGERCWFRPDELVAE
jgi:hypothetical protein